jgi:hypothetical protein
VTIDGPPTPGPTLLPWGEIDPALGRPRLQRHSSGRYVLLYEEEPKVPVAVRLVPVERRFVPRRMRFAIRPESDVLIAERAGTDVPVAQRAWRPRLFPGAAYDIAESATGVRGRVRRGGAPARWTRVEALVGTDVVGRAHGDDRGEFLLVLGPIPGDVGELALPGDARIEVRVTIDVYAHDPVVAVDPHDPLADLPLEPAAGPGVLPDRVSEGVTRPADYVRIARRLDVAVPIGRLTSIPTFVV